MISLRQFMECKKNLNVLSFDILTKEKNTLYRFNLLWHFLLFPFPLQTSGHIQIEREGMEKDIPCKGKSKESWSSNSLIKQRRGLPWWHSGWESACQCRGHGFEPWSGKIPCAAEQLGQWATTTEPARLEPVLHNKRGHDSERPMHHDEEWPPLATTRESPHTETKTQHSQK